MEIKSKAKQRELNLRSQSGAHAFSANSDTLDIPISCDSLVLIVLYL